MVDTTSTTTFQPMQDAKETLLGLQLSLEQRFGCQPHLDKNTTLNHLYGVFPNNNPAGARYTKYFCWGVGGRANDDTNLSSAQFALGTNMGLYEPRPFRAVPQEQDLTALERAKYAMREVRTINGVPYCLYWLKKIDFTQDHVQMVYTDPVSGERTDYVIDYDNLTPSPPPRGTNGVITDVADSVSVVLPGTITVTGEEVLESVSVMDGGDQRYALVSELGFVSASSEMMPATSYNGSAFTYEEAIFAQLTNHHTWVGQPLLSTEDYVTKNILLTLRNLINQS